MTSSTVDVGVLLPHFGSAACAGLIRDVAASAAEHGVQSLWARDHLLYGPHGMEDPDPTFLETFTTLGYAAAVAPDLDLGTAAVIPIRHPLMLAKAAASAAALTSGRLQLGIGAGFRDREFAAIGLKTTLADRAGEVVPAVLAILRDLRDGARVEHHGPHWSFDEVEQSPTLPPTTRLLYCGTSPLALRLAAAHTDGWVPGRITVPTLRRRLADHDIAADFRVVGVPLVVLAGSKQEAAATLPLDALLEYANGHRWLDAPSADGFQTADDLEGIVLYGGIEDITAGVERLRDGGVTDIVLDLRMNWAQAPQAIAALGTQLASLGDTGAIA